MILKDTDYLYSSARIKALETNLVDAAKISKLLDAKTMTDTVKLLSDFGYNISEAESTKPHFYDDMIAERRSEMTDLILQMIPDAHVFDCLYYRFDYHNIKVTLKQEINAAFENYYIDGGTVGIDDLRDGIRKRTFEGLTSMMKVGVAAALKAYAASGDASLIDIVLDRYCFEEMLESAQKAGIPLMNAYVRELIDTVNVSAFLRMKKMKKPASSAVGIFMEGGSVPASEYAFYYEKKTDDFAQAHLYGIGELIGKGQELFSGREGAAEFELYCDNRIIELISQAKYAAYGPEVVAGFLIGLENEFKNLRILLAGKAAKLDHNIIAARLRRTYV